MKSSKIFEMHCLSAFHHQVMYKLSLDKLMASKKTSPLPVESSDGPTLLVDEAACLDSKMYA